VQIQFAVWRQAKGKPAVEPPSRPATHPSSYTTFETKLPLSLGPKSGQVCLIQSDQPCRSGGGRDRKPVFECKFCPHFQQYQRVVPFWNHLRDVHEAIRQEERMAEMRASAQAWDDYLERYSQRRGGGIGLDDPTMQRMRQILGSDFNWEMVMGW
jgi:hypothetical protein